jgi:Ca2+-binding RTX toxin-like protein
MTGNVTWWEGVDPTPYPTGPVDHFPDAVNDAVSTGHDVSVTFNALTNDTLGDTPTAITAFAAVTAHGTVALGTDGRFTYDPAADWAGVDSFVYTIRDADGDTDTATVSVTTAAVPPPPVDHFPDAVNDAASTSFNTAVTINALANDNLGDTPTVVSAFDAVTAHGTVTNSGGSFTYTPALDWSGADSFVYTIQDTDGDTDSATVSVMTGTPPPPPPPPPDGVTLTGTSAGETLTGGTGNDTISGLGGHDWLYGGAGNDKITGGTGNDDLFGGAGADVFDYNNINESTPGAGEGKRDFIHDFQVGVDKIDLSTIDARAGGSSNQAFIFLGEGTFGSDSAQTRLLKYHYEIDGDGHYNTIIEGTTDTTAGVDLQISLLGRHALTADDFVL